MSASHDDPKKQNSEPPHEADETEAHAEAPEHLDAEALDANPRRLSLPSASDDDLRDSLLHFGPISPLPPASDADHPPRLSIGSDNLNLTDHPFGLPLSAPNSRPASPHGDHSFDLPPSAPNSQPGTPRRHSLSGDFSHSHSHSHQGLLGHALEVHEDLHPSQQAPAAAEETKVASLEAAIPGPITAQHIHETIEALINIQRNMRPSTSTVSELTAFLASISTPQKPLSKQFSASITKAYDSKGIMIMSKINKTPLSQLIFSLLEILLFEKLNAASFAGLEEIQSMFKYLLTCVAQRVNSLCIQKTIRENGFNEDARITAALAKIEQFRAGKKTITEDVQREAAALYLMYLVNNPPKGVLHQESAPKKLTQVQGLVRARKERKLETARQKDLERKRNREDHEDEHPAKRARVAETEIKQPAPLPSPMVAAPPVQAALPLNQLTIDVFKMGLDMAVQSGNPFTLFAYLNTETSWQLRALLPPSSELRSLFTTFGPPATFRQPAPDASPFNVPPYPPMPGKKS